MRRLAAAVALLAALALAATACGSDEDQEADETAPAVSAPAAESSAADLTTSAEPLPPSSATDSATTDGGITEIETEPGGPTISVPPPDTPIGATELAISVWELGRDGGPAKDYTLTCNPVGGTLPEPERACVVLMAGAIDFEPVPADAVCTMIYAGPAVATVTGTALGEAVDAEFSRENGCQAERWDGATSLLPADLTSWAEDQGLLGSTTG